MAGAASRLPRPRPAPQQDAFTKRAALLARGRAAGGGGRVAVHTLTAGAAPTLADVAAWAAPAPVPPLPVRIGELVGGGGVE